jgi:hypothetical protein
LGSSSACHSASSVLCLLGVQAKRECAAAAGIDPFDPAAAAPHELVSFGGSFHGRTLGALALTAKDQYKTPFSPLTPGALMVPYCDLEAAARVIQKVRAWARSAQRCGCQAAGLAAC